MRPFNLDKGRGPDTFCVWAASLFTQRWSA